VKKKTNFFFKKQFFCLFDFCALLCSLSQIVTHLTQALLEKKKKQKQKTKTNGRRTKKNHKTTASLEPRVNTTRDTKRRGLEEALSYIYACVGEKLQKYVYI
tara:strand:- start:3664 stop:3969 length:306 start_codon:yes stop_codon:yes gene_type:complete